METIIPLISSGTEGPLGVKHLPRLWLKAFLAAKGRLAEGYKHIGPGFDFMVLEGLGIEPEKVRTYINENKPSYLAFEGWLQEQPEVDLSPENISRVNQILLERKKKADSRKKMLAENGLEEDAPIDDSIMLNNLDDWRAIHNQLR
jgi:hypothetical protein